MPTAIRIITSAFNDLGIVPIGETVPSHYLDTGRDELNALLASWSVEGLLIPSFTQDTLTLTASKSSYTVGKTTPASDFDTEVPIKLVGAYIRDNGVDSPLGVFNNLNRYNTYPEKSTKGMPTQIFFDTVGKIYFYPTPDKAYTLYLTSEKYLTPFANLKETRFPDEYESALSSNLAVKLMPKFGKGKVENSLLIDIANKLKDNLLRNNSKIYVAEIVHDLALQVGVYR